MCLTPDQSSGSTLNFGFLIGAFLCLVGLLVPVLQYLLVGRHPAEAKREELSEEKHFKAAMVRAGLDPTSSTSSGSDYDGHDDPDGRRAGHGGHTRRRFSGDSRAKRKAAEYATEAVAQGYGAGYGDGFQYQYTDGAVYGPPVSAAGVGGYYGGVSPGIPVHPAEQGDTDYGAQYDREYGAQYGGDHAGYYGNAAGEASSFFAYQ